MSMHRALVWALALALPLAACGNREEGEKPVSSAPPAASPAPKPTTSAAPPKASAAAPTEKPFWKAHHGADPAWMLLQAAHALPDLKEPQKAAIDKVAEQLHTASAGPHAEMKAYHEALAAQVKAGKIEPAKLEPLGAALEKAETARHEKDVEAIKGLHAALDPAQRKAVAAGLKGKMEKHEKVDEAEMAKHRTEHLTKELGLDAAQQKKVEALVKGDKSEAAAHEEHHKMMEAVLAAFEADAFDAKKIESASGKKGMEAHVKFLGALLPILKPDQRDKLAADMGKPHPGMPGHEDEQEEAPPAKP